MNSRNNSQADTVGLGFVILVPPDLTPNLVVTSLAAFASTDRAPKLMVSVWKCRPLSQPEVDKLMPVPGAQHLPERTDSFSTGSAGCTLLLYTSSAGKNGLSKRFKSMNDLVRRVSEAAGLSRQKSEIAIYAVTTYARQLLVRSVQASAQSGCEEHADMVAQIGALKMQLRDQERRKLAREIHDGVGQALVALEMNLQRLQDLSSNSAQSQLVSDTRELVRDITKQIRTISYLLHPPLLDEVGLPAALRVFAEGFAKRSNITTRLHIAADFGRLPSDIEMALFRIAQESLTNIHRHSRSTIATIRLTRSGDKITLDIQDQGTDNTSQSTKVFSPITAGVGIRGMRERLAQFGGHLKVRSTVSGTNVVATVPLLAKTTAAGMLRKAA